MMNIVSIVLVRLGWVVMTRPPSATAGLPSSVAMTCGGGNSRVPLMKHTG